MGPGSSPRSSAPAPEGLLVSRAVLSGKVRPGLRWIYIQLIQSKGNKSVSSAHSGPEVRGSRVAVAAALGALDGRRPVAAQEGRKASGSQHWAALRKRQCRARTQTDVRYILE